MKCEHCGTPMIAERDPYGTGDHWYVVYEPDCTCEDTFEREGAVETIKKQLLETHSDYMKTLNLSNVNEENK